MAYDPDLRRDTPLAMTLKQRIWREGPITVEQYMQACLHDPEHGYYVTQRAIGSSSDFITAPEISQIFGELIGLWCAVVWRQMGRPAQLRLIELGPGRGTLMRDLLRAARVVPEFLAALRVELIETNRALAEVQRRTLLDAEVPIEWRQKLGALDHPAPSIVLANEFLDTSPVAQLVWMNGAWMERGVSLDNSGNLVFATLAAPGLPHVDGLPVACDGDIFERREPSLLHTLRERSQHAATAALFIDYGHMTSACGDTLQAVRRHAFEHPLTSPGEADLTAHVDFADLGAKAESIGLRADGPITQSAFLSALGIMERASRLMAANPLQAHATEAAVARLLSPTGMGTRFKVIGLRSQDFPPLPGLLPTNR